MVTAHVLHTGCSCHKCRMCLRVDVSAGPFWRTVLLAGRNVFWKGLGQCHLLKGKCFRTRNLDPRHGNPLCTWALSELPRWTLAEERSPAGFVTDTLHVPWTRLLHARIIGPRAQSSCDKGGICMISTKGITLHSRSTGMGGSWTPQAAQSRRAGMGFTWCGRPSNVPGSAKSSLSDSSRLGAKSKWDSSAEAKIC